MTLTKNLKHKAIETGFVSVGVPSPEMLRSLLYGWVVKIASMRPSVEILPNCRIPSIDGFQRAGQHSFQPCCRSSNKTGVILYDYKV